MARGLRSLLRWKKGCIFGCVCFGWKSLLEIIFSQTRMFGCYGKWLPVDQYFHLWPGNDFLPSFSLQSISGKRERERESARARERRRNVPVSPTIVGGLQAPGGTDLASSSPTIATKIAIDGAISQSVDRDLAFKRSHRREIAQLIAISPSTEIAINGATSQRVDSEIALARSRSQIAIVDDIFLGFVFSFFFSKHQKIFSGKFFEMQPNTWKYFPFPEISISGKYVFFGKRFTATKHSLRITNIFFTTYFTKTDDTKL